MYVGFVLRFNERSSCFGGKGGLGVVCSDSWVWIAAELGERSFEVNVGAVVFGWHFLGKGWWRGAACEKCGTLGNMDAERLKFTWAPSEASADEEFEVTLVGFEKGPNPVNYLVSFCEVPLFLLR